MSAPCKTGAASNELNMWYAAPNKVGSFDVRRVGGGAVAGAFATRAEAWKIIDALYAALEAAQASRVAA